MKKLHIFDITLELNGKRGTSSVIYPCEISFNPRQLRSTLSDIGNVRLPPDSILFVCPLGLEEKIGCKYIEIRDEIEQRLRTVRQVIVLPYGVDGRLQKNRIRFLRGDSWEVSDDDLFTIANKCVESSLPSTNLVLRPPHGYKFRKPSGHEVDIFVRTGNLLSIPGLLYVFSHLIICKIPPIPRTIFIDSFTILSFAMRIQSLYAHFSRSTSKNEGEINVPTIQMFPSYDVDSSFTLSSNDEYFIIISASTSNGLATKLITEHSAASDRIIHIVGMAPFEGELKNSSIYFEKRDGPISPLKTDRTNRVIGITTDEFMTSHGDPTRVRISYKHIRRSCAKELSDPFYRTCLQIRESGEKTGYGPYSPFAITHDTSGYWSEGFTRWLNETLIHEVPVTTKVIVHLDDPNSRKMGQCLKKRLREVTGEKDILCVSMDTFLKRIDKIPEKSTVAVLAMQDPGLEKLGKISVQLRSKANLYQHYIIGYSFPETKKQHARMIGDLKLTPKSTPDYRLSEFLVLPIGATYLHEFIFNDYGINRDLPNDFDSCIGKDILRRLSQGIQTTDSKCDREIFFPSLQGNKLKLRGGSIFFVDNEETEGESSNSKQQNRSQEAVYLSVALALQGAREDSNLLMKGLQFDENPFVISVLDPKMFWRFNDGIIQAALLRALSKSELDFSCSEEMSREFRQITISVLENANTVSGEAALEFLAAVVKKKVSLRDQDFEAIKLYSLNDQVLKKFWKIFNIEPSF